MTTNPQATLQALEAARRDHPDLRELIDFYLDLYRLQFDTQAALPPFHPALYDAATWRARLDGGQPLLTFDHLPLEGESFLALVKRTITLLLHYNPQWQDLYEPLSADQALDLARQVFAKGNAPAPDSDDELVSLSRLAVGAALAPYLRQAGQALLPHLDMELWQRGYCPVCGSLPDLALLQPPVGARLLICPRCAVQWPYRRDQCPFCRTDQDIVYYPSQDGAYRLYVCQACQTYLKTVDQRERLREAYPLVERVVTVGMDLAARQAGYRSPVR